MIWPLRAKKRTAHGGGRPAFEDAKQSELEAREHLAKVIDRWPEVLEVSGSLRELRQENHFAERIKAAIRTAE